MPQNRLERMWLLGGAFVAAFIVLLGYLFFIGPQRSNTSDVNGQRAAAQQTNTALQAKINRLGQETKNLATYQAQVTRAELALPSTSGLPDFLRTLQSIGNATLANVSSLTVGPPTDVTLATSAAPAAAASGTPAKSAGGTQATASGPHVFALPLTVSVSGTFAQLDQFLTQLQTVQPRAVLISQITEGYGATTGKTSGATLQLTMQAFVAPTSPGEQAQLSAASGK
jgi:Tfp pilus assembly protein PilO